MSRMKKQFRIAAIATIFGLGSVGSAAHAEWFRAETDHFVIYSEDDAADTEQYARDLERFDNALRTIQAMPVKPDVELSDANKVTIFRTGRTSNIGRLAGARGVAGFYIPRAGDPVAFTPVQNDRRDLKSIYSRNSKKETELDPRSVLQHEYVHHFMLQNFPTTYPDWYVEAFAELYATINLLDEDGTFRVGDPPQYRSMQIYNLPDISLQTLFDQNAERSGIERLQFYGYGWLLAHYLSFNKERQGQLATYLRALNSGQDGLTAARTAFGDLGQLEREVKEYKVRAKRGEFPGYNVKPANYSPPAVDLRPLTAAEEAAIADRMRSKRGVDKAEARDVANDLEGVARQYPDSLFVQLAAAEAFLDARRYEEAEAAADRAIAIAPQSSEAHFYKGLIAIQEGRIGQNDNARIASARPHLRKAAMLDRQDPRPLIRYYETFYLTGEAAPEDALIGLESAFKQAAFDHEYRLMLGRQLLIEQKGELAKTVLAPITFNYHGDQEENKLRDVVDLIDAGKVAEARDKMLELSAEYEAEIDKS